MITRRAEIDDAELFLAEHRFPIGWALAGLVVAGNIASAVLMLSALG